MAEIKDAHLGAFDLGQLSAEVIEAAPRLVAIGCFCIGINQVDLKRPPATVFPCSMRPSQTHEVWQSW